MPFSPGQSLVSRYRIDAEIGHGGTAIVYRSHDPLMDRTVAIKVFPSDLIGDEEAARQFATELKVIGQLEQLTSSQSFDPQTTTGTAYYMPPEQAAGQALDYRADIYSIGATLYEMCTGRRPYEGSNWADTVVKVLSEDPPLPCEVNPNLPHIVQDVILRAMARTPAERYSTALELSTALREAARA